jgi:tRNA (guanine37-N1)-methyltransferase
MQIDIITAFPKMVLDPLNESIVGRAISNNYVEINIHDLRDWTEDKHRTIDDTPYGGGAGMIYKVEPLFKCITEIFEKTESKVREVILTSPRGEMFDQKKATKLSLIDHLVIICGHYKGVDQRIKSFFPIKEISVGDYILSGGEIPAVLIVDATVRLLPGVISDIDSAMTDSFNDYLLDCDYYTRPEIFNGVAVPEVLLSGDHKKIDNWRLRQREQITRDQRPDLYKKYEKNIKIK